MNKDVIYIDTEDDITAIIGKIKDSKEKIIALVPPKRIGVLQSAVNLRLLSRTANNANKHIVLITNNKALIALSAASMIPVARNLQSKPEIAEIEELDTDENDDVIEGSQMPIGDLAKTASIIETEDVSDAIDTINIDKEESTPTKISFKKGNKVPNFSDFRKKLFIGSAIFIVLAIFFVWAIIFAPSAKVIITAKTSPAPVSATIKLGSVEATDVSKGIIQTTSKQIKKDISVEFTPTGKKDLGEKATGSVIFNNCSSSKSKTISTGTLITLNGKNYATQTQVNVEAGSFDGGICVTEGISPSVAVTAVNAGTDYNTSTNSQFSVAEFSSKMVAFSADGIKGGTTKLATVVTVDDVQKASQALVDLSTDDSKTQLINQFTNNELVVENSFSIERATAISVPAVDAEAVGKAKLTSATTFTVLAISKSEMDIYLKDIMAKQVGANQKVYDDGVDKVKMSGYLKNDAGQTINISTVGQIGPDIDQNSIKEQVKGKRYGDVQSTISNIQGVVNVDVKFPYFWVNTVPNELNKIDVEFKIENA